MTLFIFMSVKSKSDKVGSFPYRFVFNVSIKTRLKSLVAHHGEPKPISDINNLLGFVCRKVNNIIYNTNIFC